jgi:hypothetical protein
MKPLAAAARQAAARAPLADGAEEEGLASGKGSAVEEVPAA